MRTDYAFHEKFNVRSMLHYIKGPSLKIQPIYDSRDVIIWKHAFTRWRRKFVTVNIKNMRKKPATRCIATLAFNSVPENAPHLNGEHILHWIGVNHSFRTPDLGSVNIARESRRLEIAFTDSEGMNAGCWIASTEAFFDMTKEKAYLPEGIYEVVLKVECENGRGDSKKYRIISPPSWDKLHIREIE